MLQGFGRALAIAMALGLAAPALAQTEADRAAVADLIAEFDADFRSGDLEAVIDSTPPPVFETMATSAGMPVEQLRALVVAQMAQVVQEVEIEGFSMDFDNARSGVSETGRPFFVISTETIMSIPGAGRLRGVSDTLALQDAGRWWLLRVESPQHRQILAQTYPDLADIEFAAGVLEAAE